MCRIMMGAGMALAVMCPPAQAFWPFGEGLEYTIVFDGADKEMRAWFGKLDLDEKPATNPPRRPEDLEIEAGALAARVKKALAAKGYMEAVAEPRVDIEAKPPAVHIAVEQGVRYRIDSVTVKWSGPPLEAIDPQTLTSKQDAPLDMARIEADADGIRERIAKRQCLLSLSVTPRLRLFAATRRAALIFTVVHGPNANFGAARITGNRKVKEKVITRAIAWKQGECYRSDKVDGTRTHLIESQLFATVEVAPAATPGPDGEVPMRINVKERVARTIGAGVQYSTDEGAGVYGSWEHRNLLGGAEKFDSSLTLAQRRQSVKGALRVPAFLRDTQALTLSSSLKNENLDAYDALTFDGSVGLERDLATHLKGGLGIGYTLSRTQDTLSGKNYYALLSLPGFLEYDTRSDLMDPRRGWLARLSATPYTETVGDGGQFLKMLATGQHYLSSDGLKWKPTLATRLSLGVIYGARGDNVPADIRYYAGGGGSVRGYEYQSLSPYVNGDPAGGASLLEGSGELRLRFSDTVGGALFMDAGNAYASATPDFSEKLYVGAGAGVRYYSPVGPLRLDVAFPLNGKDIGEDGYQLYVSLGQAF